MDRLWEGVVRRLVGDAAHGLHGEIVDDPSRYPLRVTVDGASSRTLRPDALIRIPSLDAVLPIDAKYKIQKARVIEAGDLHQLATYASAFPMPAPPRAMILQPQPPAGPANGYA
jgi:hypothetical protein